ncbi:VTT domain-containing protein [Paenibacillus oenotherae]|uniref:TVP38/TMEM64 family membrane protein n=1 Tax=Paenibacillus oenotherae TaxID=1435645 RepID=A0ABS7DAF6_9BACL|nr:VTT domain-containing protein [Paenibacillus oenotherae]MBW7476929.1 VTT domain-containing protein [Paenibacillus oenotherae]
MKLWHSIIIYTLSVALLLLYKDELLEWLVTGQPHPLLIFLFALCLIIFPIIPYKIVIVALGLMYGPLLGAFLSWSAASIGSVFIYLWVRKYARNRGRTYLSRYKQLEKMAVMMERSPFLAIFLARLVPFFPQTLVNIYPAFLSIRTATYAIASALGKIPIMLVISYLGSNLLSSTANAILVIGLYAVFLGLVYAVYRLWLRERLV